MRDPVALSSELAQVDALALISYAAMSGAFLSRVREAAKFDSWRSINAHVSAHWVRFRRRCADGRVLTHRHGNGGREVGGCHEARVTVPSLEYPSVPRQGSNRSVRLGNSRQIDVQSERAASPRVHDLTGPDEAADRSTQAQNTLSLIHI